MKNKTPLSAEETQLFLDSIGKVKRLRQDTVVHHKKPTLFSKKHNANQHEKKQSAVFHFSDEYEPYLSEQGPVKFVREGTDSFAAKNLRRGLYQPDLILDLHGLDQLTAKKEVAALLYACQKEHAQCVCIIHGIGSRVLKNKVPHWLVQHPDVLAFHQAPLEWGGDGAILALIKLTDKFKD